jgi:NADP-dependent 3-hydroxy acid dehydrogenase YdfG
MANSDRAADPRLEGRKALIVGAYGGMGRAVALALAREGVACALMGRDREKSMETAKECAEAGTAGLPVVCDIARTETIERAVRQAIDGLGGLNFLVNCAGSYQTTTADKGALETWDRVLDVNLKGTYHLARHALPEINKSPGGAIIKIGSIASSYSGAGAFLATTRGLDGYADALFEDVREYGTKVCTIRPGFVNTSMVASDRLDPGLMIQPEDIARTVLFVLTMPENACPTEITIRPQRSPYRSP